MLEAEFTPDVERRVNEGFKSWMGSSYLSSDDDDEDENDPNAYHEVQNLSRTNSSRLRVWSVTLLWTFETFARNISSKILHKPMWLTAGEAKRW